MFILGGAAVVYRSVKQSSIADSTMEPEYIAASEAVWLKNFLSDMKVVPNMDKPVTLYCDNSGVVTNSKEPHSYKRGKHIVTTRDRTPPNHDKGSHINLTYLLY